MDSALECAGWAECAVFAAIAGIAAVRTALHVPPAGRRRCGASVGFHGFLFVWALVSSASAFLFVQPYDTAFGNLVLDTATKCLAFTVSPRCRRERAPRPAPERSSGRGDHRAAGTPPRTRAGRP